MRIDWDDKLKLTQAEKLVRIVHCHTGRKHQHRKGPGRISEEQLQKQRHSSAVARAKHKKFLRSARAYWRGEREEHP